MTVTVEIIITISLFLFTLIGFGVRAGMLKGDISKNTADISSLKERLEEDRNKDNKRIEELYNGRNFNKESNIRLESKLDSLEKSFTDLKIEIMKQIENLSEKIERINK